MSGSTHFRIHAPEPTLDERVNQLYAEIEDRIQKLDATLDDFTALQLTPERKTFVDLSIDQLSIQIAKLEVQKRMLRAYFKHGNGSE